MLVNNSPQAVPFVISLHADRELAVEAAREAAEGRRSTVQGAISEKEARYERREADKARFAAEMVAMRKQLYCQQEILKRSVERATK